METLLEYLIFVKGIGYLLVVAFLLAFLTFWKLIHTKENEIVKVVPLIVVMWITFGATAMFFAPGKGDAPDEIKSVPDVPEIFPEYYSNGSPATITAHRPEKWLGVNSAEYLSISYGSASKFHEVMSKKLDCEACHHNSDEIHACRDCHSAPFNPENLSKPGIKAAIHQRCMYCHKEVFSGPEGCKLCHTNEQPPVSVAIPARPHELTWKECIRCHKEIPDGERIKVVYHDFCIKCHTKGIADAAKLPADHANRTSNTCKDCHKPAGGKV